MKSEHDEKLSMFDKEERYFFLRLGFTIAAFWAVFHVFGIWVLFTHEASGPLGAAIFIDVLVGVGTILWQLSKRFVRKDGDDEGQEPS